MALCRNVLQQDDILWELYSDTRSDVSDYSDSEISGSDSDIPTSSRKQYSDTRSVSDYSDSETSGSDSDIPTSSRKQLQSSVVVVTSDSETSTIEE